MLSQQLKSTVQTLWDSFWSGGIANPLTAIEQMTYLIFLKRLEDGDDERARDARKRGEEYQSIFEGTDEFRWSHIKQMESEARLRHMQRVFDWLKQYEIDQQEDIEPDKREYRFRDAVFVIPSANLLQKAVTIIDDLFVPSPNDDAVGDIYELLLSEIAEAGKNGQFRTPRHIIRAIIDMVNPRFGERVCDPACGTGGFLINSYIHIRKEYTNLESLRFEGDGTPFQAYGDQLSKPQHDALLSNHFYGFDFDRTMVRLSWMNMIQHGMKKPRISYADTLGSQFNKRLSGREVGEYDVVLANPPFTGSIDASDIGESLQWLSSTKTELLFVDLILQLLSVGGRAAVIVPEGLLFGSTRAHVSLRKKLLNENQLNAVISLPGGVFQPYTGVKTSILVFTKGGTTKEVWFYDVQADGLSLDAKRTARPDHNDLWDMVLKYRMRFGQQRPAFLPEAIWRQWQQADTETLPQLYLNPLVDIELVADDDGAIEAYMLQGFETLRLDEPNDWSATVEEIKDNDFDLSAGRYKPFSISALQFDPPQQLIHELQQLETKVQEGLARLSRMLEGEE